MQITQEVVLSSLSVSHLHNILLLSLISLPLNHAFSFLNSPHAKLSVCIVPFTQVQGIGHLRHDERLEFLG